MKVTSSAALTREALPDAPDGEWFDSLLEKTNVVDEQLIRTLQGGFSIADNTPWKFVTLNLQHGVEVEVKNPFDDPSMPVKMISIAQATGLTVGADGRPTGSTYSISHPTLSWRPSGKPSNSVFISAQYQKPFPDFVRSFVPAGSAVTISASSTPQNVTSMSLPPGDWDVSCVLMYLAAAITGNQFLASISTVSATNGVFGDNRIDIPTAPTTISSVGIDIPSYRLALSATTTVYLVAFANFSVGTLQASGRLSARAMGPDPLTTAKVILLFQGA